MTARWKKGFDEHKHAERGLTLIEVMLATSIFVVVLTITAQSLLASYTVLTVQQQRTMALNGCRAVVSSLRQTAYNPVASDACPELQPMFPCALLAWIADFPDSAEELAGDVERTERYGAFFALDNQRYGITCVDGDGQQANVSPLLNQNSNPVYITVTTTWTGAGNRDYSVSMNAVLTDR